MDSFEFEMTIIHVLQTMKPHEKRDKVGVFTTMYLTQLSQISSKDYQYISSKYNIEFISCSKSNQLFIKIQ
jgi:hypothetical protein